MCSACAPQLTGEAGHVTAPLSRPPASAAQPAFTSHGAPGSAPLAAAQQRGLRMPAASPELRLRGHVDAGGPAPPAAGSQGQPGAGAAGATLGGSYRPRPGPRDGRRRSCREDLTDPRLARAQTGRRVVTRCAQARRAVQGAGPPPGGAAGRRRRGGKGGAALGPDHVRTTWRTRQPGTLVGRHDPPHRATSKPEKAKESVSPLAPLLTSGLRPHHL